MASNRSPSASTYWTAITSLVDGDLVTFQRLYAEAIHRVQDNIHYVLGKVSQVYTDLASTATGTQANLTGSVNITTFNFDSGLTLNGLTLILDEDTTTPQTVTFGVVTNVTELLQAFVGLTNIQASLNSQGKLVFKSGTVGAGSTIFADPAGTAYALLLDAPSSQSGSGTVADGTTRLGFAGYVSGSVNIAAGTLRNALEEIIINIGALPVDLASQSVPDGTTKVGFSGYTSGAYTILAGTLRDTLGNMIERIDTNSREPQAAALPNTSGNVDLSLKRTWTVPVFAGASITYTLPVTTGTPPLSGDRRRFISRGLNDGVDVIRIASEGAGDVFQFTAGNVYGYVDMQFEGTANGGSGAWIVVGWAVDGDMYALLNPYP